MKRLVEGFARFRSDVYPEKRELFESLKSRQAPLALLVACSDSRVMPEMIMQADPGQLFVCRNAGNIVPAWGEHTGGVSGTIEYAVSVLEVENIVICGHSDCGAMKALLHPEKLVGLPAVSAWLGQAEKPRRMVADHCQHLSEQEKLEALTHENILTQIDNLATHPSVASALAKGTLALHAWVYNIPLGTIDVFDASKQKFVQWHPGEELPVATPQVRRFSAAAAEVAR